MFDNEPTGRISFSHVNNTSDSTSKIKLFMSLFKGRDDVHARKWENKKKATSGYAPVCLNQWQVGLCGKPKTPCSKCTNQLYAGLDVQLMIFFFNLSRTIGQMESILSKSGKKNKGLPGYTYRCAPGERQRSRFDTEEHFK